MAEKIIGPVGLNPCGNWDVTKADTYRKLCLVTHNNASWIYVSGTAGSTEEPSEESTVWQLNASGGTGNTNIEYMTSAEYAEAKSNGTIDPDKYYSTPEEFTEASLYGTTGQNVNGAMTQKAVTDALAEKASTTELNTVKESLGTVEVNTTTNLLKPTLTSKVQDGVTCTANGDGTYTFTGKMNNEEKEYTDFYIYDNPSNPITCNKMVGCPSGGSDSTYKLYCRDINRNYYSEAGDGSTIIGMQIEKIFFRIQKNYPNGTITVKPMLTMNTKATFTDYVSYTGSTGKLNSDVAKIADTVMYDNSGSHNCVYRGKFLGTSLTAEQSENIRNGSFKDLYIGDYWTIGGVNYRIADFDYFLQSGDTACTTHHAVVVPDTIIGNAQMNASNVTTGAYVGSAMYTTNLSPFKTIIKNAFGVSHILTHREYLKSEVTNGYESGGSWYDSDIEFMTEQMVYGAPIFANSVAGTSLVSKYTVACKQLNLFRYRPDLISNRNTYWLRDVVNASSFANVSASGGCGSTDASSSRGVRPAFCIY